MNVIKGYGPAIWTTIILISLTPSNLRPTLELSYQRESLPGLTDTIRSLANLRISTPALKLGNYQELYVSHNQLAFPRTWKEEKALAAANTADYPIQLETNVSLPKQLDFTHALDPKRFYQVVNKTIYPQLELYEGVILVN